MKSTNIVRDQLISALSRRQAHVLFEDAVARLPGDLRTAKPKDVPYNIWRLAEHIRITQWDIVEFSYNPRHQSPPWPEGYWPLTDAPTDQQWDNMVESYKDDLTKMISLIKDPENDVLKPFPHGNGQNLLREAILLVDHTAYHTGQIVTIRKHFDAWK